METYKSPPPKPVKPNPPPAPSRGNPPAEQRASPEKRPDVNSISDITEDCSANVDEIVKGHPEPYQSIGFGAMGVTKPYTFIGLGAMDATKPYKFIGFGALFCAKLRCFGQASPPMPEIQPAEAKLLVLGNRNLDCSVGRFGPVSGQTRLRLEKLYTNQPKLIRETDSNAIS